MVTPENGRRRESELEAFGDTYAINVEQYLEGAMYGVLNPLDKNSVSFREDYEPDSDAPGSASIGEIGIMRAVLWDQLNVKPQEVQGRYTYPTDKGEVNVRIFAVNDKEGFEGWELQEHIHLDGSTEFMIGEAGLTDM